MVGYQVFQAHYLLEVVGNRKLAAIAVHNFTYRIVTNYLRIKAGYGIRIAKIGN